MRTNLDVTA